VTLQRLCKACPAGTYSTATAFSTSMATAATVTVTSDTPRRFGLANHGLLVGDPVAFVSTGVMPVGVMAMTTYFVYSIPDADSFTVSTDGITVVSILDAGTGTITMYDSESGPAQGTAFSAALMCATCDAGEYGMHVRI
jgi:hypothetical protein